MAERTGPRILISRMSAVGDTILTLPVACALRERFPNAFLGWVVEQRAATVVRGHKCLDEVVVLKRGWFTSAAGIRQARRLLKPLRFETSIDCQGLTKSSLAAWLSGARRRIGLRGQYGCELSPIFNNRLVTPQTTHLTDRSLELLAPLGVERPRVDWQFPMDEAARSYARSFIEQAGIGAGYAVINPGANYASRLWEKSRFAAVARHLGSVHSLPSLVVWGTERELNWAREIVATSAGYAWLAPTTNLLELAALIEPGRLFLSADTGPLHLAVAVGTPSIALHSVTRPQDSGPYGPPHMSVQAEYVLLSRRQRKRANNDAMRKITTETVCRRCDEMLDAGIGATGPGRESAA